VILRQKARHEWFDSREPDGPEPRARRLPVGPPAAGPLAGVFTGAPLVLITCGGPFDAKAGSYRDNIVVHAVAS
jgi:hypothetical protein